MHYRAVSFCLPTLWVLLRPGRKGMAQGQSGLVSITSYLGSKVLNACKYQSKKSELSVRSS